MKIFNCYHPKVITNPYSGQKLAVKCGKCNACKNARIQNWVMRLDMEASCHKYCYFLTLTYDELNVPQVVRLRYEDHPFSTAYINSDTGELIDMKDVNETFTAYDKQYIKDNKVLNVLDKTDFQKFIKRLRYHFSQCEKEALLRYYLVGEIGPSTFRPHGHCLLFFDSDKCAENIRLLLAKSWKHGVCYDPHPVSGSAASYCAAYLNGTSSLPKCYLHKSLKPFSLFSKSPAIGTLFPNVKEVKSIFDRGDITFRRFDKASRTFKDEFILQSVKSRLYPRCQRFGSLSHDDRITLYRLVEKYPSHLNAREIADRIKGEYLNDLSVPIEQTSFLKRYFREIAYKNKIAYHLTSDKSAITAQYKDFPFLPSETIEVPFYAQKTVLKEYCHDSLVRFVRTLRRVQYQAQIFGYSIPYYVTKIELFYENLEKYKIKMDYAYQDEYFKTHPLSDFVFFDDVFVNRVNHCEYQLLSDSDKFYLASFGITPDSDGYVHITKRGHLEYKNLCVFHDKVAHDLVKQKKNNDYVLKQKDKYYCNINFKNI